MRYLCYLGKKEAAAATVAGRRATTIKPTDMTQQEKTAIEERIVDVLRTVYDPEIPVNIYDLGLIYKVDLKDTGDVDIDMTFTAPSCPAADFILEDVRQKVDTVEGVRNATVNLVFEPV